MKVWVILLLSYLGVAKGNSVQLKDNKYSGVVIAISSEVPEANGEAIIQNIKSLFSDVSYALYIATNAEAYFGNISVLIPTNWFNTSLDSVASFQNYQDADIVVDGPNGLYGDAPYTEQPLGCGQPGTRLHLSPGYLLNLRTTSTRDYGNPGKVLVHEWAHYRYGVYDEYGYPGDERYPPFYYQRQSDGSQKVVPNSCLNSKLNGYMKDMNTDGPCAYNKTTGLPDANCRFFPYKDLNDATTSMMSYSYLKTVELFCDRTSLHEHVDDAPNQQNALCGGRSVWEVISSNKDFIDNEAKDHELTYNDTIPEIKIFQQQNARYVLVLDDSGSMGGINSRIEKLTMSAQRWLQYEVQDGSSVGIIEFNACAKTDSNVIVITSQEDRNKLIDAVPTQAMGSTCIGCGLKMGLEMLDEGGPGGVILLLTDGENIVVKDCIDGSDVSIDDMLQPVRDAHVRIITMAFGPQADDGLEKLAEVSGGKTFFIPDTNSLGPLNQAFDSSLTYQPGNEIPTEKIIQILEVEYSGAVKHIAPMFSIDASTGRNLHVQIDYDIKDNILSMALLSPNGTNYTEFVYDDNMRVAYIDEDLAQIGSWTLQASLAGTPNQDLLVTVTTKARSNSTQPILSTCWLSSDSALNVTSDTRLRVLAKVTQGQDPVVDAHVRAQIQPPTGAPVVMDLYDSGSGADLVKDDGVYTRFFTDFSDKGRYSVRCEVWDDGSAFVNQGFTASRSLPVDPRNSRCCGSHSPIGKTSPTGNFTRSNTAGSFQVANDVSTLNLFPPSRVIDLTVVTMNVDDLSVNLTWTAPGGDLDSGNASLYILKYSNQFTALQDSVFDSGKNTTEVGNMSTPLPVGQRELVVVDLAGSLNSKYFFALKAADEAGNKSPVSNIVQIFITVHSDSLPDGGLTLGQIVSIAVVTIVSVAIIGGVAAFCYNQRKRQVNF